MFTALKAALATTKAKFLAVLFGALVAVIITLATLYHLQGKTLQSTTGKLSTVTGERDSLKEQLRLKVASDKIDDTVRHEVSDNTEKRTQVHEQISSEVDRDVQVQKQTLEQQGASESTVGNAVAERSYGGVWDHFCATVPDHPSCAGRRVDPTLHSPRPSQ